MRGSRGGDMNNGNFLGQQKDFVWSNEKIVFMAYKKTGAMALRLSGGRQLLQIKSLYIYICKYIMAAIWYHGRDLAAQCAGSLRWPISGANLWGAATSCLRRRNTGRSGQALLRSTGETSGSKHQNILLCDQSSWSQGTTVTKMDECYGGFWFENSSSNPQDDLMNDVLCRDSH